MKLAIKPKIALALAAVSLAVMSAASATMAAPAGKVTHGKKAASHTVYICKDRKVYFSPMAAKKMGYKDPMGHMLVKVKNTPAGYMDASKMKM